MDDRGDLAGFIGIVSDWVIKRFEYHRFRFDWFPPPTHLPPKLIFPIVAMQLRAGGEPGLVDID